MTTKNTTLATTAARIGALALSAALCAPAFAAPDKPECIAPAKPGGGFDLTCRLIQSGLQETKAITEPMRITYMPGGVGAVAYNTVIAQRPADKNAIVAFSTGSLLNLAQGKFGKYTENDVRWVGSIGTDYGALTVRADSPINNLKDLIAAIKADSAKVVFGAAGTIGSQDWMKAALTAKAAGVNHKAMRFVAFEGGGEGLTALLGGHVQVFSGDASEAEQSVEAGNKVKVIAVFSDKRLPGTLANVPTAKEQGFDIVWPTIRGVYVGPQVSDAEYQAWKQAFDKLHASPAYAKLRADRGLQPLHITGAEFDKYVKAEVARHRVLSKEFELLRP